MSDQQRTVTIELSGGDSLTFGWSPQRLNEHQDELMRTLRHAESTLDGLRIAEELAVTVLTGWDVTEGGKPMPINRQTWRSLPETLRATVMDALFADHRRYIEGRDG